MSSDISIIIVSWNTRELLKACLESVFANLGSLSAEVFVVDNASTDGSAEMVMERYHEVRLIENSQNLGFAAANNQAIKLATGRYILLLNSDTVVLGNVLENSVEYMDSRGEIGVMGCRVLNGDRTVQLTCFRYPSLLNTAILASGLFHLKWLPFFGREQMMNWHRDSERDVDVVTGCFLLARTAAISGVGHLDESFFFCGEESDWCLRFKNAGWKVRFAPVGEIVHFGNASGSKLGSRRDLLLSEGLVRFLKKHNGILIAAMAWCLLLGFCVAHLIWWTAAAPVCGDRAVGRRNHFYGVVKRFNRAWPAKRLGLAKPQVSHVGV